MVQCVAVVVAVAVLHQPAFLFKPYSSPGGALLAELNGEASAHMRGDGRDQCALLVDFC